MSATDPNDGATVILSSDTLTAEISTDGAELRRLATPDGLDLMWNGDPTVWSGRAPILFPVIGMVQDGRYRLDGASYPMPKHGFARHSRFTTVACDGASATLRLSADATTRAIYPFEFRLDLTFALAADSLLVTAEIGNSGDAAMPASFGFHPALRWPLPFGRPRGEHRIRFDVDEPAPIRRIDAGGLLTAADRPTPVVGDTLALRDDLFVDDALIFDRLHSRRVRYGADDGPQIEVAFADFPTLGVWTKPGAGFLCIEPWHGFADPVGFAGDFRDKPGSFEVAPGSVRTLAMRLSLIGADRAMR